AKSINSTHIALIKSLSSRPKARDQHAAAEEPANNTPLSTNSGVSNTRSRRFAFQLLTLPPSPPLRVPSPIRRTHLHSSLQIRSYPSRSAGCSISPRVTLHRVNPCSPDSSHSNRRHSALPRSSPHHQAHFRADQRLPSSLLENLRSEDSHPL